VPASSSTSSRSRAVILPFSSCAAIRSAPPPSSDWARFCCRSSSFSRIVIRAESRRGWTGQLRLDAQTHRGEQRYGGQEFLLPLAVFPCASAASVRLVLPRLRV